MGRSVALKIFGLKLLAGSLENPYGQKLQVGGYLGSKRTLLSGKLGLL